jgi:hypothetical protein
VEWQQQAHHYRRRAMMRRNCSALMETVTFAANVAVFIVAKDVGNDVVVLQAGV